MFHGYLYLVNSVRLAVWFTIINCFKGVLFGSGVEHLIYQALRIYECYCCCEVGVVRKQRVGPRINPILNANDSHLSFGLRFFSSPNKCKPFPFTTTVPFLHIFGTIFTLYVFRKPFYIAKHNILWYTLTK